jgi:hypothetical protein
MSASLRLFDLSSDEVARPARERRRGRERASPDRVSLFSSLLSLSLCPRLPEAQDSDSEHVATARGYFRGLDRRPQPQPAACLARPSCAPRRFTSVASWTGHLAKSAYERDAILEASRASARRALMKVSTAVHVTRILSGPVHASCL